MVKQKNIWAFNLCTGDVCSNKHWREYYDTEMKTSSNFTPARRIPISEQSWTGVSEATMSRQRQPQAMVATLPAAFATACRNVACFLLVSSPTDIGKPTAQNK